MTEKEYNDCVNLYADNVYRFILKNTRHEEDAKEPGGSFDGRNDQSASQPDVCFDRDGRSGS